MIELAQAECVIVAHGPCAGEVQISEATDSKQASQMSRKQFPEGVYRGWHYTVVIVPAPENRFTFVARFRRGDEPARDDRPNQTYLSWEVAAARGELFALEWIDREETTPR